MIIDIHTHAFPDRIAAPTIAALQSAGHIHPFTDGTVGGLTAMARKAGIDCAVILPVATRPEQVVSINDASRRISEAYMDCTHTAAASGTGQPLSRETRILSFGCMHPDFPSYREELARIAALGLRGIKLHPVYQNADFDDIRYLRILDQAGELGLAVLIHAGLDVGFPGADRASPAMIRRVVRSVGPVRLILAHMGGWRQWDAVSDLLPDTGVFLDTSFSLGRMTPNGDGYYQTDADLSLLDRESFLRLVRLFGSDRILFGTDCPWGDPARSLAQIRALPLTDTERNAILGENARRLLGLAEPSTGEPSAEELSAPEPSAGEPSAPEPSAPEPSTEEPSERETITGGHDP